MPENRGSIHLPSFPQAKFDVHRNILYTRKTGLVKGNGRKEHSCHNPRKGHFTWNPSGELRDRVIAEA